MTSLNSQVKWSFSILDQKRQNICSNLRHVTTTLRHKTPPVGSIRPIQLLNDMATHQQLSDRWCLSGQMYSKDYNIENYSKNINHALFGGQPLLPFNTRKHHYYAIHTVIPVSVSAMPWISDKFTTPSASYKENLKQK